MKAPCLVEELTAVLSVMSDARTPVCKTWALPVLVIICYMAV